MRSISVLIGVVLTATACKKEEAAPEAPRPRPVTVIELAEVDPTTDLQIMGSVESWKEQDVSFEVGGRVEFVVEGSTNLPGIDLAGRSGAENVLGRVDPQEYVIARDSAMAAVDVAAQKVRLAEIQRDQVIPADIRASEANRELAQAEFERYQQASSTNAVSKLDAIRKEAERDKAVAELDQASADLEAKKAEIDSLNAQLQEAKQALAQAQYDLDRCVVPAPFMGEISQVYVEAGGTVRPNDPVAHLVMMDPIKVDIALSAEMAAKVRASDRVRIFPPGFDEPVVAWVYEKGTIADPATRTFRVSMMARNGKRKRGLAPGDPLLALPAVAQFMSLTARNADDLPTGPWGVEGNRALREDDTGWFVWGSDEVSANGRLDERRPVLTLKKYRVVPSDEVFNVQGLYVFRMLEDVGELARDTIIALDVPDEFQEGEQVLVASDEWMLRPGQLVPVVLDADPPKPGLYVPMSAVMPTEQGAGITFVVDGETARRVPVRIVATVGDRVRIESTSADGAARLVPGARLVVDYLHFLVDGESVRVVKTREVRS